LLVAADSPCAKAQSEKKNEMSVKKYLVIALAFV
jgi:hypothetical protein